MLHSPRFHSTTLTHNDTTHFLCRWSITTSTFHIRTASPPVPIIPPVSSTNGQRLQIAGTPTYATWPVLCHAQKQRLGMSTSLQLLALGRLPDHYGFFGSRLLLIANTNGEEEPHMKDIQGHSNVWLVCIWNQKPGHTCCSQ